MTHYLDAVKAWYGDPKNWLSHGVGQPDSDMLTPERLDGKDVLDVGCGFPDKELVYAHRARTWVAIDFVKTTVERARAMRPWASSVQFLEVDFLHPYFEPETFDTVCDFSSGDHLTLEDYRKFLREAFRVLRHGGHLIVAYANCDYFADPSVRDIAGGNFGYERRCSRQDMTDYLMETGFEVVSSEWLGLRSGIVGRKP